jgi:hypothetical protein
MSTLPRTCIAAAALSGLVLVAPSWAKVEAPEPIQTFVKSLKAVPALQDLKLASNGCSKSGKGRPRITCHYDAGKLEIWIAFSTRTGQVTSASISMQSEPSQSDPFPLPSEDIKRVATLWCPDTAFDDAQTAASPSQLLAGAAWFVFDKTNARILATGNEEGAMRHVSMKSIQSCRIGLTETNGRRSLLGATKRTTAFRFSR